MAEKFEIIVDGQTIACDGLSWDYPQTDGESSGATDENVMIRDVLPERMKLACTFQYVDEAKAAQLLRIRALAECNVNFYDLRTRGRVTRKMYPVSDEITAHMLLDGTFYCEPFELRFIQMVPDGV